MGNIQIRSLQKSYGAVKILKGIDLDIQAGELVSLLGPSGSGKTTILRCIAGLEVPDSGSEITLDREILNSNAAFVPPENRRLGMVFQNYAVWPHLNVFENVAFPLRIQARNGMIQSKAIHDQVMENLQLVKLDHLKDRYAHQLSGGQQQRVALARALAMSPRVLLLDEPLSNLDAILREELGAEIRRLQKRLNLTAILVTHDQREALSLSDRIILLDQGKIQANGSPENLYADPPSDFVAEFISGGQKLTSQNGEKKVYLPRRWTLKNSTAETVETFQIVSRIYLGAEYEYWGQAEKFSEPVRFFSETRHEIGTEIELCYKSKSFTRS
jgi:iron(III) transport system ATP-binding protein